MERTEWIETKPRGRLHMSFEPVVFFASDRGSGTAVRSRWTRFDEQIDGYVENTCRAKDCSRNEHATVMRKTSMM